VGPFLLLKNKRREERYEKAAAIMHSDDVAKLQALRCAYGGAGRYH